MRGNRRKFANEKILIPVLCICVAVVTIATGIYVAFSSGIPGIGDISEKFSSLFGNMFKNDKPVVTEPQDTLNDDPKETDTSVIVIENEGESQEEKTIEEKIEDVSYIFPERIMAITLTAGEDYNVDSGVSIEEIKKSIDDAVTESKNLSADTIYANLSCSDNTVLFNTGDSRQKKISIDVLKYLIDSADQHGMNIYFIYNVSDYYSESSPSEMLDNLKNDIGIISSYDIDGILIDSYELYCDGAMYDNYLHFGDGIGFDNYLCEITDRIISEARDVAFISNPKIPVGLAVEPVWANSQTEESGSNTESSHESLVYGHSDTKTFVLEDNYDFTVIKAKYSIGNKSSKYSEYITWWDNLINDTMPMYVYQYATKACTDEKGWSDPSELSDQVIAAEKKDSFEGSIFDSLSALKKNPKQSTDALVKYLTENVDPSFLLTQLEMTRPTKTTFSTYETVAVFAGASDNNFDLLMNGEKVKRDSNGAFMLTIDLTPGLNTFTFTHKEKTITYNITRNVQVLKEISPMGSVTASGGMSITVTALAYEDSVVTASLGSTTISLNPSSEVDDSTDNDSTYKTYSGTITVPKATAEEQKIGNIIVRGKWSDAAEESMTGAYVTVAAKATSGSLVEVTADAAETFPIDTLNDLSDYDCYPLARGTKDYTVGDEMTYVEGNNTYNYYILESGQRVYSKDVKVISGEIGDNTISDITVNSNKRFTYVTLDMSEHVSYIAKYSSSSFSIDFQNTVSVPDDLQLECTPLFDSAKWDGTKLVLKLSTSSGFLGYFAYYDGDKLIFRFNNPTGSYNLSGVPIVIDVGHSALGVGAMGYLSAYGEYEINLAVCKKLKSELESLGATVYMMDTENQRPSLEERNKYAFSKNPLLFISIHCNSSKTSSGNGTEVFYFTRFSSAFASYLSDAISYALETENRGGRLGRYYVTRTQAYPSVLGEMGFVSNESDYYKMIQTSYQYDIAEQIAESVSDYMYTVGRNGNYSYGTQSASGISDIQEPEEETSEEETSEEDIESSEAE